MKRIYLLAVFIVLVFLLSSCGETGDSTEKNLTCYDGFATWKYTYDKDGLIRIRIADDNGTTTIEEDASGSLSYNPLTSYERGLIIVGGDHDDFHIVMEQALLFYEEQGSTCDIK